VDRTLSEVRTHYTRCTLYTLTVHFTHSLYTYTLTVNSLLAMGAVLQKKLLFISLFVCPQVSGTIQTAELALAHGLACNTAGGELALGGRQDCFRM